MKNRKIGALVVLALLILVSTWLLPSVVGEAQEVGPNNSLVRRVEVLEEQVAGLLARVEELEQGGGDCCDTFDVIHLTPLAVFPAEPSEGDLCVRTCWFAPVNLIYCYLNGEWQRLLLTDQPGCPGRM